MPERRSPLPIAIADQHASVRQYAINRIPQVAHGLHDEGFVRMRGGARDMGHQIQTLAQGDKRSGHGEHDCREDIKEMDKTEQIRRIDD